MEIELTYQMGVVLAILGVTIALFVTEVFRIDFSALLVLVSLGLLSQTPGLESLADPANLFEGFASNAVISIIAVMIIGAGLDKTGLMSRVAAAILKYGGKTEIRIIPIISGTVGIISSFMQNVGAAALFLPVVSRISVRTEIRLTTGRNSAAAPTFCIKLEMIPTVPEIIGMMRISVFPPYFSMAAATRLIRPVLSSPAPMIMTAMIDMTAFDANPSKRLAGSARDSSPGV